MKKLDIKKLTARAEKGDVNAQYQLGTFYRFNQKYDADKTVYWLKKAADQGHAVAQNNLGGIYYYGDGVKPNHKEGIRLFRLAAEQGSAVDQCVLARIYCSGKGVKLNYERAIELFHLSAGQGYPHARSILRKVYRFGKSMPKSAAEEEKDMRNALKFLHKDGLI